MIGYLFYSDSKEAEIKVNEDFERKTSEVKSSFQELIKPYELMDAKREEEIFIQIAQVVAGLCR